MTDVTIIISENHANRLCWLLTELTSDETKHDADSADLKLLLYRIHEGQNKNALKERLREIAQQ